MRFSREASLNPEYEKVAMQLFLCKNERNFKEIVASLDRRKKLVLFGAGRIGMHVLLQLEKEGIAVDYFVDNDWSKVGTTVYDGVPVISSVDLIELAGRGEVDVLITMVNFSPIFAQLRNERFATVLKTVKGLFNGSWPRLIGEIDRCGRVVIPSLRFEIFKGCNFKCKYCSHFSPLRKGMVSTDEISRWLRSWSQKILPHCLRIMGGEPLLHPDAHEILLETRRNWPEANMELVTNGMLFEKAKDALFGALRSTKTSAFISKHYDDENFNRRFWRNIAALENHGIPYKIHDSFVSWIRYYRTDNEGRPTPFHGDPEKAFEICYDKNCFILAGNMFHRCTVMTVGKEAREEKILDENWKLFDDVMPLDVDCTSLDFVRHVNSGPFPACSLCPDQHHLVVQDGDFPHCP